MRTKSAIVMAGAILLWSAPPVVAHHAFSAEFDASKPVKLVGTVTRVEWINPHAWIHVNVKNPDGTVSEWAIEGGTPNTLLRRGIDRNSLPPGTAIIIEGYLAKAGGRRANGRDLTFADGRKLFVGSSGTGAPQDGRDPSQK
jgi:uncharacterized protein DUF6152